MTNPNPLQMYVDHLLAHTVRIVRNAAVFERDGSVGSGVLLARPGGVVLVTAGHNVSRGTWTLETNVQVDGRTLTLPIPNPQRLAKVDLRSGEMSTLDIAWAWLDLEAYREVLRVPELQGQNVELSVYQGPIDAEPTSDSLYGFAAHSRVQLDANLAQLDVAPAIEIGMEFKGTDEHGLYEFALARPHQGKTYYEGASGAPIADEIGVIVAILLKGLQKENVLFGFPLARIAHLITGAERADRNAD